MGAADNRIDLTPGTYMDDTDVANQTTSPGMLVVRNSSGGWDLRQAANLGDPVMVAATAPERGKSIGDNYVQDETLRVAAPDRSDLINVLVATGVSVTVGSLLQSVNGGFVDITSTGPTIFVAEEAVAGGAAPVLCRARGAGQTIA